MPPNGTILVALTHLPMFDPEGLMVQSDFSPGLLYCRCVAATETEVHLALRPGLQVIAVPRRYCSIDLTSDESVDKLARWLGQRVAAKPKDAYEAALADQNRATTAPEWLPHDHAPDMGLVSWLLVPNRRSRVIFMSADHGPIRQGFSADRQIYIPDLATLTDGMRHRRTGDEVQRDNRRALGLSAAFMGQR